MSVVAFPSKVKRRGHASRPGLTAQEIEGRPQSRPDRHKNGADERARRLPIWHGGIVVAHALLDAADFLRLDRHRWRLDNNSPFPYRMVKRRGRWRILQLSHAVLEAPRSAFITHLNCDRLDCRRENLTLRVGHIYRAKSKRNPWGVSVGIDRRHYRVGVWPSRERAEAALASAARVAATLRGRGFSREEVQCALDLAAGRNTEGILAAVAARLPQYLTPDEREDASQSVVLDLLSGEVTLDRLTPEVSRAYGARAVGMARDHFRFVSLSQPTEDGREFGDHLAA